MGIALAVFFIVVWVLIGAALVFWGALRLTGNNRAWAGSVAAVAVLGFLVGALAHPLASGTRATSVAPCSERRSDRAFSRLQPSGGPAIASMDYVGYTDGSSGVLPITSAPLSAAGSLVISGWAADSQANKPAKSVFAIFDDSIRVGGILNKNGKRPDVAKAFHNPHFLDSGFALTVSLRGLAAGDHTLQLGVLTADGKHFTIVPRQFKFSIQG